MKVGIADTMFARVDMFKAAKKAIEDTGEELKVERYTVPGIKDLPAACKKLFGEHYCDICIAFGMPGPKPIDKQCAHESSQGLINVQLMANKHIIEVFVHLDEGNNDKDVKRIAEDRAYKHTLNAIALLKGKEELSRYAGQGKRQGHEDAGNIE